MSGSGLKPATRTIEKAQADVAVIRAGAIIASKSMACTAYVHNKDKRIVGWVIDGNLFENASAPLSGIKEIARGYLANAALVNSLEELVAGIKDMRRRKVIDETDDDQWLDVRLAQAEAALKAAKGEG